MLVHLLKTHPRALILEEQEKALVLAPFASLATGSSLPASSPDPTPTILAEFVDAVDYTPLIDAKLRGDTVVEWEALGCIGVLYLAARTFVMVITAADFVGPTFPKYQGFGVEAAWRVKDVAFFCLETDQFGPNPSRSRNHPCRRVHEYLTSGSFYYSGTKGFDITSRLELQLDRNLLDATPHRNFFAFRPSEGPGDSRARTDLRCDARFLYNIFALSPLLELRGTLRGKVKASFDNDGFCLPLIQGYYAVLEEVIRGETVTISVRSRLGWKRAGTRLNKRGIDRFDLEGAVANFAETETIFRTERTLFTSVQVRGSVPLMWSETGHLHGPDVHIKEPVMLFSLDPFRRHFYTLFDHYKRFHSLCLLSNNPKNENVGKEFPLATCYRNLVECAQEQEEEFQDSLVYQGLDIEQIGKDLGMNSMPALLEKAVADTVKDFGATVVEVDRYGQMVTRTLSKQSGVFRVNCRDCSDRTNLVQSHLAGLFLDEHLKNLGFQPLATLHSLISTLQRLFYENGEALATSYTGTGAMYAHFTLTGVWTKEDDVRDLITESKRYYQYLHKDNGKQLAVDQLVGAPIKGLKASRVTCLTVKDFQEAVNSDSDS